MLTEAQKTVFTHLGKLLPDIFAVFDLQELRLIYLNPAGQHRLDPNNTLVPEKLVITDFIGMNDIDRFHREIFLKLRVLGLWTGMLSLRDLLGSEFPAQVKLLEAPGADQNGRHLYLYAGLPHAEETAQANAVSDQDMLHALLDSTSNSVYYKDIASRFLRISQALAKKLGISDPREAIGKTDFDYFTVEHAAPAFKDEQQIIRTNLPVIDLEEKETFSDGSIAWVSTTKLPFHNRAGKLIGTFGISRDITASKAAEEKLRMLSRAVDQSPISILITDKQGTIEYVNPYFEKTTGFSAAEAIGQNPRVLKSGNHLPGFYQTIWSDLAAGREWNGEIQNRRKNGELFWEQASISGIRDAEGTITHFIAVKEDITEHKKAEESLRESGALFKAVFDGSNDAIILLSENRLLDCNSSTLEMFGYSKAEMQNFHPADFSPPLQPDGRESSLAAKAYTELALNQGGCSFDWVHRRRDGTDFPAEVRLSSFEFHGKPIIHGTVRDVSEQKLAEQAKREMESRLQLFSKLESVGLLAAGVAHEINTPTQFISDNIRFLMGSFTQLNLILKAHRALVEQSAAHPECGPARAAAIAAEKENELDYLTTEIPRCLEQSLDGLKRIGKIVGSLKEFSHPGGADKSGADLNRAIETTIAVSRHEWKYVAEVVTELDPSMPPVHCVIDEISQVVLNLVVNATHAVEDAIKKRGEKRGLITIRTRKESDNAIIEVQDSGSGIPEHVRGRIFEPFFTTKTLGKGTGQGLAIVQAVIVKKHRGSISFTTELDKGTTFKISLPITPSLQTVSPNAPVQRKA